MRQIYECTPQPNYILKEIMIKNCTMRLSNNDWFIIGASTRFLEGYAWEKCEEFGWGRGVRWKCPE